MKCWLSDKSSPFVLSRKKRESSICIVVRNAAFVVESFIPEAIFANCMTLDMGPLIENSSWSFVRWKSHNGAVSILEACSVKAIVPIVSVGLAASFFK